MTNSSTQIQADFDRLAAFDDGQCDHKRSYHDFLLRFLPPRRETALEVGCGAGAFARLLAQHFDHVLALDLSPEMIRRARELSPTAENVEFRQADITTCDLPAAAFDCIASIATLHHVPLEDTLTKLGVALRPGGVLLILDLYQPRTLVDWLWTALAYPFNLVLRVRHLRQLRAPADARRAWSEHAKHDVYPTLMDLRSLAWRLLPGATIRRHFFWRYSLIWEKARR